MISVVAKIAGVFKLASMSKRVYFYFCMMYIQRYSRSDASMLQKYLAQDLASCSKYCNYLSYESVRNILFARFDSIDNFVSQVNEACTNLPNYKLLCSMDFYPEVTIDLPQFARVSKLFATYMAKCLTSQKLTKDEVWINDKISSFCEAHINFE